MGLLHRDDLPYEIVEELEKAIKKFDPKAKIAFAGDLPEGTVPDKLLKATADIDSRSAMSLANGTCFDCGKAMPGGPPENHKDRPDGWSLYDDIHGEPAFYQCPECDKGGEHYEEPPEQVLKAYELAQRAGVSKENCYSCMVCNASVKAVMMILFELFRDNPPDPEWSRDWCLASREHYQLTPQGWMPAKINDGLEVLDEVNSPEEDDDSEMD